MSKRGVLDKPTAMGAVLLASGTAGKRYALPHSTVLIHQPISSGIRGQASDISIHAEEILRIREELYSILSTHTNQPLAAIQDDADRDFYMTADKALEYGIVDHVVAQRSYRRR